MFRPRCVLIASLLVIQLLAINTLAQNLDLANQSRVELTSDSALSRLSEQDARRALDMAEANQATVIEVARAANALASALLRDGRPSEAKQIFEQALHRLEVSSKPDELLRSTILNNLGTAYWKLGDYNHTASLLERAVDEMQRFARADSFLPELLNNLGLVYTTSGNVDRAEKSFKRALQLVEKYTGSDDPRCARILLNLGFIYIQRENWSRAETALGRAQTIMGSSEDPKLGAIFNGLGKVYYNRGNLAAAETAFRRALDIWEVALGPRDFDIGIVDSNLADILSTRGEYEKAQKLYAESLEIQEQSGHTRTVQFAKTLERFGQVLRKLKNTADAVQVDARAKMIRAELAYTVPVQRTNKQR